MFRIASHGRYVAIAVLLLAATSTQAGFGTSFESPT
jgi:hypothetical protein